METMTIGELSKRTGVSRQTIHYYLKEGLLPKPIKTSATWAYYTLDHVERINRIKGLQEKHFLPLRIIKDILEKGFSDRGFLKDNFLTVTEFTKQKQGSNSRAGLFSREVLSRKSGADMPFIDELEEMGLLLPRAKAGEKKYNNDDLAFVQSVYRLIKAGDGCLEDLQFYKSLLNVLSDEMNFVHKKIIRPGGLKAIGLKEITAHLETVRNYFEKRIYHFEAKKTAKR